MEIHKASTEHGHIRLAAASDAHGSRENMNRLLQALPPIDMFCYLGDTAADASYLRAALATRQPDAAFHSVSGNVGPDYDEPAELTLRLSGFKLLMVHGHILRVKLTTMFLAERAKAVGAQIALYGHTHIPDAAMWRDGVMLINPGALRDGRYALITLRDDVQPDVRLLAL
ncbi:phosphoesterase [Clostridia bacterium]|nr:phosphoesterase [Clostridia bacterium]